MKAYEIRVSGKVQGVFFRASTKEKADELSIKGWVKNESDGSVLIQVEGPEQEIEAFVKWCYQGPPTSKVDRVEVEPIVFVGYHQFKIKY